MFSAIKLFLYALSDLQYVFAGQFAKFTKLFAVLRSHDIGTCVASPLFNIGMPDNRVEVH
jgi:hypothetical protein